MTTNAKPIQITEASTLAELATAVPYASRIFHDHGLDFCCGGKTALGTACASKGIDAAGLIRQLQSVAHDDTPADATWHDRPIAELVDHIVDGFHAAHRRELPRLQAMAAKVERVHADKPDCPHGLADLLAQAVDDLELHMQKEEQVLFPMLRTGHGRTMAPAVRALEQEHDDHGRTLARMRQRTHDHTPPPHACNTWRALYLGLLEFERELMHHVHLENHVLFPRALA